ncbi:MAG: PH domain-containing protein [Candidatus Saccharibacteria bacterium]
MNPQNQSSNVYQPPQPGQPTQVNNPLNVMQKGERNIFEVKRHPFGMIGMYVAAVIMLVVLAAIAFFVLPSVAGDNSTSATSIGAVVFLLFVICTLIFLMISHIVYWGNRWILTTDSLTQVTQRSLFDKRNSQLSLANLEDITAEQEGLLAHLFGFGTLRVETAGERSKFVFTFCPNPNYYAQQVLNAREQYEQGLRENDRRPAAPDSTNPGQP